MFAGRGIGFAVPCSAEGAVSAEYAKNFAFVQGVVLMIMGAVFTNRVVQINHLKLVIEFITLNVNRVIFSMV